MVGTSSFLTRFLVSRHWAPGRQRRDAGASGWRIRRSGRTSTIASRATPGVRPLEWFQSRFAGRPFGTVLVPGCGTGELERDLVRKGICERVLAFDPVASAVEVARQQAAADGFEDRIEYTVGDSNAISPPEGGFGACFFHHALHHFPDPDGAVRTVTGWLEPGGILYLDEYVGPSRRQWTASTSPSHRGSTPDPPRAAAARPPRHPGPARQALGPLRIHRFGQDPRRRGPPAPPSSNGATTAASSCTSRSGPRSGTTRSWCGP